MDWIRREKPWPQFFRHYRKCCRIVGSACHSALLTDPALAEEAAKIPKSKHPDAFGFTAELHALRDIADLLLARMVKDPGSSALPRPLTGADVLALRKRQAGMDRLVATWSPQHAHLTPKVSG